MDNQIDNRKTIFDIAELLKVDTKIFSFGPGDEQIIFNRIIEQLEKVPYIPHPVSLHTVDIILTRSKQKHDLTQLEVLMGRKKDKTLIQFIGGFMDPIDNKEQPLNSVEHGAIRELWEETKVVFKKEDLIYLGSHWIDDVRYQNSSHQITSSIFTGMIDYDLGNHATGADDIEEVYWVPIVELKKYYKEKTLPAHQPLVEMFLSYLKLI